MKVKDAAYSLLVNKDDEIRKQYLDHRFENPDKKLSSFGMLLNLNIRKHLLHKHIDSGLNPDDGKKAVFGSESEKYRIYDDLSAELGKYDVISFDVFDTLVLRKVEKPADVFYILQDVLDYPGLRKIRISAEAAVRNSRHRSFGDHEVTIEEIWSEIESLTGIPADKGIEAEWDAELKVCFGNPLFLDLISSGAINNKNVIVCTDTYWDKKHISELLQHCGYSSFSELYVSSEWRKSKSDGRLFRELKRGKRSKKIIHVGDDHHSDIQNPEKAGIDSYFYQNVQRSTHGSRARDMSPLVASAYAGTVNSFLRSGAVRKSREFELGFIYGGLFVSGFCRFIKRYSESNGIDKIMFLSRDGDILKKAYDYLYPDDAEKTEYVYWSRLAGIKACAQWFKPVFIERMITHKTGSSYSINDVFSTMEITDMLEELFNETGIRSEDLLDRKNADALIRFIQERWDRIVAGYKKQTDRAAEYISGIIGDAGKGIIIDIGWTGSGPVMIKKLMQESGCQCELRGLLAGTAGAMAADHNYSIIEQSSGVLNSYLFSPFHNRAIWKAHDVGKDHNLVMEILLSSDQPSLRGFGGDSGDGLLFAESAEIPFAAEIQDGIMTFVKEYNEHPFSRFDIPGADAYAPIALINRNPEFIKELVECSHIEGNIE